MTKCKQLFTALLFLTGILLPLPAQNVHSYPVITSLESKKKNVIFRQFQDEVARNYRMQAAGEYCEPLFFRYVATESDNLFTLSSRCSLPVETIALLNHLPSADTAIGGRTLYLPTGAGLFISTTPHMFIETLLCSRFDGMEIPVVWCGGEEFFFIPGARLTGAERLYFLDSRMKAPLSQSVLTSSFGNRISPITGKEKFHKGIDLAAELKSPVYACLSGKVSEAGYDEIYGNYVIIDHDDNLQSLYAHLDSFTVSKGKTVAGGSLIGYVGLTGATTGPHLHFEVRQNGVPLNPEELLAE